LAPPHIGHAKDRIASALCVDKIETGVMLMIKGIVPIIAIAALFLIGCGESRKETANDIATAVIEADKSTTENQEELGMVQTSAMSRRAQAKYDLAINTAEESYKAVTQKCNDIGGPDLIAYVNAAEANLTTANAVATAMLDAALVAAK
jgi:hypothetical protein